ncbi:MAG: glucose-1-phosphate adenylyltransferase subunit GlgD [Phascolarctobacterium sp.]|nr:glucose-1-phosphate adenylyltransferase subunit GlgD [Phascolarctobacterium sp.]
MIGLHGLVFAYQTRPNLKELVTVRSSASIPFGGRYRAIDFALSNLQNAGCTDVGILVHGKYQSLIDHLGNGKAWDMARIHGGLKILPPFTLDDTHNGTFRGKMEALAGIESYLRSIRQDYVVLMEGDLVSNLPLRKILEQHIESGADITCVCGNDSFYVDNGVYFEAEADGKVKDVMVNIHTPRGRRGLEVYVMSTQLLIKFVEDCIAHDRYSLEHDVLQANKDKLNIRTFIWDGYAAQIRSVKEFYDRSMQLLDPEIREDLFCEERQISAKPAGKSSTFIMPGGSVRNSLIADGCVIEGSIENSIVFAGVTVGKGAKVSNCVVFKNTQIGEGAEMRYIIADKDVQVGAGQTILGSASYPIVVGKGAKV